MLVYLSQSGQSYGITLRASSTSVNVGIYELRYLNQWKGNNLIGQHLIGLL